MLWRPVSKNVGWWFTS